MLKTASPTSSTRRIEPARAAALRGFTLVEVLVAFGISSILLTGVMTTFLMMARTGKLAQNYTELEVEARKALETFSRDARMAYGVSAWGNTTVTFQIPDSSNNRTALSYSTRYTFNTSTKTFTRQLLNSSGAAVGNATVLVTNVQPIGSNPYIRYFRYVNSGSGYTMSTTATNYATSMAEVKQVELNFIAQRNTDKTVASSTDKVLSARFILRNK